MFLHSCGRPIILLFAFGENQILFMTIKHDGQCNMCFMIRVRSRFLFIEINVAWPDAFRYLTIHQKNRRIIVQGRRIAWTYSLTIKRQSHSTTAKRWSGIPFFLIKFIKFFHLFTTDCWWWTVRYTIWDRRELPLKLFSGKFPAEADIPSR
jgi:hypothetical protein